jgi:hypothetical protein
MLVRALANRRKIREQTLLRIILLVVAIVAAAGNAAAQNRPTRFWNLTRNTISEFYLAPAGTSNWGPNQCKNDKDGTVEHDERLRMTDLPSGTYDAKFADVKGRICIVRGIRIETGAIFTIDEKDVRSCEH